jgi:hypothetical protein
MNCIRFLAGPQGEKGDKGEKGDTGPQGPAGEGGSSGSSLSFFTKTITTSDWTSDGEYYYNNITHNLGKNNVLISAIDTDTKFDLAIQKYRAISINQTRVWVLGNPNSEFSIAAEGSESGFFTKTVLSGAWIADGEYYYNDITHNLNKNNILISILDTDTHFGIEIQKHKAMTVNSARIWIIGNPNSEIIAA